MPNFSIIGANRAEISEACHQNCDKIVKWLKFTEDHPKEASLVFDRIRCLRPDKLPGLEAPREPVEVMSIFMLSNMPQGQAGAANAMSKKMESSQLQKSD